MADPIQTARIVEAIKAIIRSYEVVGVAYADEAGSCYRVMSGCVAFGGDYADLAEAQAACDQLNAQAALSTAYPMIREEMARIADAHADDRGGRDRHFDWHDGYMDACRNAATAIRATELAKGEE